MPIAYGMVAGRKHADNVPAPDATAMVVEPVAQAGRNERDASPKNTVCPSCGLRETERKIKNGMCRECRYEARLPIHARNMRRAWRRDGRRMKDVAVKLHIKPSALSNYMTGRVSPTLAVFSAICRELGVMPNDVLGFESKEKK